METSAGDKRAPLSHTQKDANSEEKEGVTPPGLKGAAEGNGGGGLLLPMSEIFFLRRK